VHCTKDFFATVPHVNDERSATRVQVTPPTLVLYPNAVCLYSPGKRLVQPTGENIAGRNTHHACAFRRIQLQPNPPFRLPSREGVKPSPLAGEGRVRGIPVLFKGADLNTAFYGSRFSFNAWPYVHITLL
jgi:hypothetical protein